MAFAHAATWSNTLTKEQARRVMAVLPEAVKRGGNWQKGDRPRDGWSVRMSPTTRVPTELEVLHRDSVGRVIRVYPVMRRGEFV